MKDIVVETVFKEPQPRRLVRWKSMSAIEATEAFISFTNVAVEGSICFDLSCLGLSRCCSFVAGKSRTAMKPS